MLRVLQVTTVPATLGFFRGQAAFMAEHGIELRFVCSDGPERVAFEAEEGVVTHAIEMRRAISPRSDVRALRELVRLVRRVGPHVMHAHTPKGGLLGTAAATLARVPRRVYTVHGLRYTGAGGWQRRLLAEAERATCAMATDVVAISHSVRRRLSADGLCAFDRTRVLAHGSVGVDALGRFDPARLPAGAGESFRAEHDLRPEDWVVLFVGRVTRDKGIRELLAAWEIVARRVPRARLCIVGPTEDVEPELLERMRRGSASIRRVGPVRRIERAYAAADVLVLPSYREGFSTVLLEAAAMRVPRVASAVDGCTDAIEDGRTGRLVPPRAVEPLAEALARVHEEPDLAARWAEQARRVVVERYQPTDIWRELAALYLRPRRP